MNKCRFAVQVSAYSDKELSETQERDFQKHLEGCAACAQELTRLTKLSEHLKAWKPEELQEGFERSVREKIVAWELERGDVKMKKRTSLILIPSGVLAGLLLFLVMGKLIMSRGVEGGLRVPSDEDRKHMFEFRQDVEVSCGKSIDITKAGTLYDKNGRLGRINTFSVPDVVQGTPIMLANGKTDINTKWREPATQYFKNMGRGAEQKMMVQDRSGGVSEASALVDANYDQYSSTNGLRLPSAAAPAISSDGPVIVIQPALPATGVGDKIIRTAEVRLEVEDGKSAYKKASALCQELGGYMAASNFYKDREGREAGTITMRIPKDKFLTALEKLGQLGRLETSQTDSKDVSQEYANLRSHLDAAMVVYNKMLQALEKKQVTIPEAIRLESELTPVLSRVEDLKNQIEALNNAVSFTTITVYFHEPAVSAKVLHDSKRYIAENILTAKINAVRSFAQIIPKLPALIILLVIFVVIVIAAVFLVKQISSRSSKKE